MTAGKIRYMFLQFPFLGAASTRAAIATECATKQDKFWEYHDAIFEAYGKQSSAAYSSDALLDTAGKLGLNKEQFSTCMSDPAVQQLLQADVNAGRTLGVNSTPTLFIADKMYRGLNTFEFYSARIEEALAAKR